MNHKFDKLAKGLAQSVVRSALMAAVARQSLLLLGWLLLATPGAVQAQVTILKGTPK
jgi:hypothetical protein